jgi:hypothetical protein
MRRTSLNLTGGLAHGMRSEDFDQRSLREGTEHEMEHTDDPNIASEIAMDHLFEDPDYYKKLRSIESTPNRKRVKVYNAEDIARNLTETFKARPVQDINDYKFSWPSKLRYVGDSHAIAYDSDKWTGNSELYKHLAESRNRAFVREGFLKHFDSPNKPWPTIGPVIDFTKFPMPRHFAELALFVEIDLQLHTAGSDERPSFGKKNSGFVKVTVAHGLLGGGKILWSRRGNRERDQPFLFVYTEYDGVQVVITGDELDIESDGIVG